MIPTEKKEKSLSVKITFLGAKQTSSRLKINDTFQLPKSKIRFKLVNIVPPDPKTKVLGWIELKPVSDENKDVNKESKEKRPANK